MKASECTTKGYHVKCRKCGAVVPDWCGAGDDIQPSEVTSQTDTPAAPKRVRKTK